MFVCVWSTRKSWFPNRRDTYVVIHDFTKRNTLGNPHIIYRRPMTIGQVVRGSEWRKGTYGTYIKLTDAFFMMCVSYNTSHHSKKGRLISRVGSHFFHHLLFLFILGLCGKSKIRVEHPVGGRGDINNIKDQCKSVGGTYHLYYTDIKRLVHSYTYLSSCENKSVGAQVVGSSSGPLIIYIYYRAGRV